MEEQEVLSTLRAHVAPPHASDQTGNATEAVTEPAIDPAIMASLSADVWHSSSEVGQLNPRNPGLLNQAIQSFKKLLQRSLNWYTRPLQVFHRNVAQAIEQHGQGISALQSQLVLRQNQLVSLQQQLLHLEHHNSAAIALEEVSETARLAIQEQQSPYVRLFHGLSPVVDFGCGRGEFLELLKNAGIESYGVDSDTSACEVARRKHLKIVEADLFQYLKQLPERSLGGVFSARLIEYLPPHMQSEFIALCSSKLKPGGRIVIETINPDSDSPFGRNWRLDPGHLHPIYSETLRSILESNGFRDSQICILAPHVASIPNTGEAGAHSGNGRGGEIVVQPSITSAPAYAAIGTRT